MSVYFIENRKTDKIFKEYEDYFQPVILLDSDFNVIYKNGAAKIVNIKPRAGTNIKKYMDGENIAKLYAAVDKDESKIIRLDVISPIKRCVVKPYGKEITAMIFYDALNLLKDNDINEEDITKEIEELIGRYCEAEKNILRENQINFSSENNKKLIRFQEHLKKHLANLNFRNHQRGGENKYKNYCDVGEFLNGFVLVVSQYINSFGYKIAFNIEDRMFYYKLNEGDLMTVNFILAAFAFKHAVFNKVDLCFYSDFDAAKLKYEFRAGNGFMETHKDMFVKNYIEDLKDIAYIDLNLAALVAKNNDLKLEVYFDSDSGKVCMALIFCAKKDGIVSASLPLDEQLNYIDAEDIKERLEIEFAGIFMD